LSKKSKKWQKYFEKKHAGPRECIDAIPAGYTQSLVTLLEYYLIFHPKLINGRRWLNVANTLILCEKNKLWREFLDKKYATPQECIKAIPSGNKLSIATIVTYYLTFHPELNYSRGWVNVACAAVLYNSSKPWQRFFDRRYKTVWACIAAMPKLRKQSIPTIINYYFILNPELKNDRDWANAACAEELYRRSEEWRKFMNREFSTLKECIKAAPARFKLSLVTRVGYYLAHRDAYEEKRDWIIAAVAIVFFEKFPEYFFGTERKLRKEIYQEYFEDKKYHFKLPLYKTVNKYLNVLVHNNINKKFIVNHGDYVSFFRKNGDFSRWLEKMLSMHLSLDKIIEEYNNQLDFPKLKNIKEYIKVFSCFYNENLLSEMFH
ncbi:MAG: hypothetical protein KKA19_06565, partial [Candidatus Margulisbacteria bacterium]|nr:hypothetical protein [Candidatus Margulisiibacteriota bacterium]